MDSYPSSRINTFLIAQTSLLDFQVMDEYLKPVKIEDWSAWTFHAHGTRNDDTLWVNHAYPPLHKSTEWFPHRVLIKPLNSQRGFSPVRTFFQSKNSRTFLNVRTFGLVWPGSMIFMQSRKSRVLFPFHPNAHVLLDDEPFLFPKPDGNDWVSIDITNGTMCKIIYYNLNPGMDVYFS